ncbi:MAG: class I SAM-dependent methyltransferase [Candidatus Omnitrophota bacterium]|jgi:2-polyprenyl-3-methyl-5-hydroxy-6-metoxy-1,4-benzoquinol methylase|nr:MAG: class I SAM-dependent methyltransferase [Candidatus Omnitrophota bacterium]
MALIINSEECIVCNNPYFKLIYDLGQAKIVKCTACGLMKSHPILSDIQAAKLYNDNYFESKNPSLIGYGNYFSQRENYLKTFSRRYSLIKMIRSKGALLDIGSGPGFFVEIALKNGWDAFGLDISEAAVKYAEKSIGDKRIFLGNTKAYYSSDKQNAFDIITMWDYIEHSFDPAEDLSLAWKMLKENGMLIIETQDSGSLAARILKERWWHMAKYREHIYHFSRVNLKKLLENNKFTVQYFTNRHCGKYIDINFIIERMRLFGPVSAKLSKLLLHKIGNPSFYVNPLDEMIVVARKFSTQNECSVNFITG